MHTSSSRPLGSYTPTRAKVAIARIPTTRRFQDGIVAVRPARDLVVVDAEPFEKPSTVIIPETAARPGLYRGKVLAIGPKAKLDGHCKVGDQVIFFRYESIELNQGERTGWYFVPETELIGMISEIDKPPVLKFQTRTGYGT